MLLAAIAGRPEVRLAEFQPANPLEPALKKTAPYDTRRLKRWREKIQGWSKAHGSLESAGVPLIMMMDRNTMYRTRRINDHEAFKGFSTRQWVSRGTPTDS